MNSTEEIIHKIKEKKELSGIGEEIISEKLDIYLKKHKLSLEKVDKSGLKVIVKDLRSALREHVGRFQVGRKDRTKLLESGDISELLKTHTSTKERLSFYPELKEIINKINPKSILDLGCGINPIALADKEVKYYATDINLEDLNAVKGFFTKNKIKGETFTCDLTKIENCQLPEVDLCLALKVLDILGKEDYKIAKKIIENVKTKKFIISFSTRTISGKRMNKPRRLWFEKLLNSISYKFDIISSENEIFYII